MTGGLVSVQLGMLADLKGLEALHSKTQTW